MVAEAVYWRVEAFKVSVPNAAIPCPDWCGKRWQAMCQSGFANGTSALTLRQEVVPREASPPQPQERDDDGRGLDSDAVYYRVSPCKPPKTAQESAQLAGSGFRSMPRI